MLFSFKSAKPVTEKRPMGKIPFDSQGQEKNRVWRLLEIGKKDNEGDS